jgi:hypothetical protein
MAMMPRGVAHLSFITLFFNSLQERLQASEVKQVKASISIADHSAFFAFGPLLQIGNWAISDGRRDLAWRNVQKLRYAHQGTCILGGLCY